MSQTLVIRAPAEADIADAFRWYERQRKGLGRDLLLSVEATLAAVQRRPESFPVVHGGDCRRALLKRFPYSVYFVTSDAGIAVVAVMHAKRDPTNWQRRADDESAGA